MKYSSKRDTAELELEDLHGCPLARQSSPPGAEPNARGFVEPSGSAPSGHTGADINYWALFGFLLEGWIRLPEDQHRALSRVEPTGGFAGDQSMEQPRLRQQTGELT